MSAIDKLHEIVTLRLGTSEECSPEQGLICSAGAHLRPRGRQADYVSVCPLAQRARVRERIAEDVARLRGLIENANVSGGFGLWGYDVHRHPKASEALDAAWAFVDETEGGLLLAGPLGLGKTRLLLGVHFELLCAGIDSRFVLSSELREAFRDAQALDDGVHVPARLFLERLQRSRVILWDDAGDVDGDERARGTFAEGIKKLLDLSAATWALSTNLTADEFAAHKDLGRKVLSRVLAGARVVKLEGRDQRHGGPPRG